MFNFDGQVVLITGGAGSIGRSVAQGFLAGGAGKVVLLDNSEDAIRDAVDAVGGRYPGRVAAVRADVRKVEETRGAIRSILDAERRIDVLFNNAGVNRRKPSIDVTEEDWDFVLEVNLKGLFFVTQEVGRHMLARRGGCVVNTASVSSVRGHRNLAAYAASKGGIAQLTRVLANEWAPHSVRVNAVAPGYLETGLTREYLADPAVREDPRQDPHEADRRAGGRGGSRPVPGLRLGAVRHGGILFVDGGRTTD